MMGKGVVDVVNWGVGCEGEREMVFRFWFRVQAGTDVVWDVGIKQVLT